MPRKNKEKKPFNETTFGKILGKASEIGIDVADIVVDVATGDIRGAVDSIGSRIKEKAATDERAQSLLIEFEREKLNFTREMYSLEVADRDSARNREVEIAKTGVKNYAQNSLAYIGVGGFLCLVAYLVGYGLPDELGEQEMFMIGNLTGTVATIAATIFNYYFGTSQGSRRKNEIIQSSMNKS